MRIGRVVRVLEDKKRKETLVEGNDNRKVIISFYYPINERWQNDRQAFYMDLYSPKEDEFVKNHKHMITLQDDKEKENFLKNIKTNIYNNAPIKESNDIYPVVLHSTGLGCSRDYMTFNTEALVNAGYVVFTIEHLYDSMLSVFPNGTIVKSAKNEFTQEEKEEIINIRRDDILFILDELKRLNEEDEVINNKLNLDKVGVIGHSLGGAAVFRASKCDSRIKATVIFDASLQFMDLSKEIKANEKLLTPLLNFRRGSFDYETSMTDLINYCKDATDAETFKKHVIIYDNVLTSSKKNQKDLFNYLSGYKSFIKLKGSRHITFNDCSIIKGELMESETLSSSRAHEVINEKTIRFLNEFLLNKRGEYSSYIKNDEYIELINENGEVII